MNETPKNRQSRIGKLILPAIFTVIFASLAFAQTEKPASVNANKIAVVDFEAIDNHKTGVKELTVAYDALEIEFKAEADELKVLADKIINLEKELTELDISIEKSGGEGFGRVTKYKSLADEYTALGKIFKEKQGIARARYEKRRAEEIAPIMIRISKKLEQFRKKNGYIAIIDKSKLESIYEDDMTDVTAEFIEYYNSVSEKQQ